jgi:hypothetical protein
MKSPDGQLIEGVMCLLVLCCWLLYRFVGTACGLLLNQSATAGTIGRQNRRVCQVPKKLLCKGNSFLLLTLEKQKLRGSSRLL